jgi:cytidine deaminase
MPGLTRHLPYLLKEGRPRLKAGVTDSFAFFASSRDNLDSPPKPLGVTDEELIAAARAAALRAYAPYSRFSVGCAIESVDGEVVTGANMENACYRLGLCAEQSALTAAQHAFGLDKVARIAVAGGDGSGESLAGDIVCKPCGGCRQAIHEASCLSGRDIEIICSNGDGWSLERHAISTLFPHGFGPANLADAG